MIKKSAVVFTVILLGGCVSAPDKTELRRADYGKLPENYQEIIKGSMPARLKDPYSARYDFNEPFKGGVQVRIYNLLWMVSSFYS